MGSHYLTFKGPLFHVLLQKLYGCIPNKQTNNTFWLYTNSYNMALETYDWSRALIRVLITISSKQDCFCYIKILLMWSEKNNMALFYRFLCYPWDYLPETFTLLPEAKPRVILWTSRVKNPRDNIEICRIDQLAPKIEQVLWWQFGLLHFGLISGANCFILQIPMLSLGFFTLDVHIITLGEASGNNVKVSGK